MTRNDGASTSRRRSTSRNTRQTRSSRTSSSSGPAITTWDGTPRPTDLDATNFTKSTISQIPGHADRASSETWMEYHSVFYNGWLGIQMEPTRMIDPMLLQSMGIEEQLMSYLDRIGLGTMPTQRYDLYPELSRQFLATCEVVYDPPFNRTTSHGHLTFFANGMRQFISLNALADLYGLDKTPTWTKFAPGQLQLETFWNLIGDGPYSRMKTTTIKNPILRIAEKVLSNTLFCRQEADRCRREELFLLMVGLGPELCSRLGLGADFVFSPPNLAGVFAEMLCEKKLRCCTRPSKPKVEFVGSLLTPIFDWCRVDLSFEVKVTKDSKLDAAHMESTRTFIAPIYHWLSRSNESRFCTLPKPAYVGISTLDEIRFELPTEELCNEYGYNADAVGEAEVPQQEPRRRRKDARAPRCRHGQPYSAPAYLTEPLPDAHYDLVDMPAETPVEMQLMYEAQRRQLTVLQRILNGLSWLKCRRPPSCCTRRDDVIITEPVIDDSEESQSPEF